MREFRDGDGPALRAFWEACGIRIRPGDDDPSLASFAQRNPELFLVATDARGIVGTTLAAWDGRRAWLYHVMGCPKVNLIVWEDNVEAMAFWEAHGYTREKAVEFGKAL